MQTNRSTPARSGDSKPWYAHRWPWLLMLGPFVVILAGVHTTWLAFSRPDALVVDDYYKQGKAINQDLRRDRVAADLKLAADLSFDAATGRLIGAVRSGDQPRADALFISLIHSTQPEKDVQLQAQPDADGRFSVPLPMLDMARWQVQIESGARDWRLKGVWAWPQQKRIELSAEAQG